ncbi:hypothetical protein FTO60_09980 [Octadecabacter sp. SW4]|uniref:hypothetical protein n=1 Tax=Octadecabacter sp. SW4 TaxID=2602067 RepID=UPI0011C1E359|nr:hypothetical protein [Octadecabacter sp. SW4]QEE36010.1 hypothetical protein FTO60_09980 [Octadecabacter sp. SW4]
MFKRVIFRATVILSMVATKAAATIVPAWTNSMPTPNSNWSKLDGAVSEPFARRELNPDIISVVTNHQRWQDYEEAIRVTYAMARTSEIGDLDELWASVLIEHHGPEALSTYLAVRGQINLLDDHSDAPGYFMENWLWNASSGSGDS